MKEANSRIYLSPPDVDEEEVDAVSDAVRSNWVAPLGPHVNAFEQEFADYVGAEAAAAVSSGTAGLHLAATVLGIDTSKWVLAPTLTFVATLNALAYTGARIVLVDSNSTDGNIDVERTLEILERSARDGNLPAAVVTVDLYGAISDVDALISRCRELGVAVIEDAAEALGSFRNEVSAGNFGDIGVFSFNGNKIITTSGGGMCVGSADDMDQIRWLASQAKENTLQFEHQVLGYNYRMSNLLAAVGRVQLGKLDGFVERRREIFERYRLALEPLGVSFLNEASSERRNCWLTVCLLDHSHPSPVAMCEALESKRIEARPGWKPMHLQPLYQANSVHGTENSELLYQRSLCLPSGSSLTADDQKRVLEALIGELR